MRSTQDTASKKPFVLRSLAITFLGCWAVFLLIELFRSQLYVVIGSGAYLDIHNFIEVLSVCISLSIFGFGWFTYRESKNNYTLFLGVIFLAAAILDLMHMLSFPGMPPLITPSSTDKGIQFWLAARLVVAVGFLASAFIPSGPSQRALPGRTLLTLGIVLPALYFCLVVFYPQVVPVYFVQGTGLTPLKVAIEYLIIAISLVALIIYYFRQWRTGDRILVWVMTALLVTVFGELAFTLYKSAYDTFNLVGHIYKIVAFVLIYRGVFISSANESYVQLEQSEKKFETAFFGSPNLMAITLPDTGEIVEINDAFCKFFGYTRQELIGVTTAKLGLWADPKQRDIALRQLRKEGTVRSMEVALRTKSGEIRNAIDSLDFITINNKKHLLSVAVDITDRKQVEEALHKDEEHIKQLSDLRAKFIQIIAHQLRTPLGSIRWNLESMMDGSLGPLTTAQKKFLGLTHDADVMVIDRINDLLAAIDIEEGRLTFEKSNVSIDSMLKSIMVDVKRRCAEKGIACEYSLPKEALPSVEVDPQKTRLAFEKLIDNAIVFTPKKGKISLTLKHADSSIRFEVKDTGIGIPDAEQQYLFESFFRASNAYSIEPNASGVGLVIAKSFVQQQGGEIGFVSKEGKGSTFWIELPVEARGKHAKE